MTPDHRSERTVSQRRLLGWFLDAQNLGLDAFRSGALLPIGRGRIVPVLLH
jgi:hypothetical protein